MQPQMQQGTFFNTLFEKGTELKRSREKCGRQEAEIAALFTLHGQLSPSQAHQLYSDKNTPLTSIRRAICVLAGKGFLEKTNCQIQGVYGKPESVWKRAGY